MFRYIELSKLRPHPQNPRKKLGYQVAQEEQEYYNGTHKDYYHDTME